MSDPVFQGTGLSSLGGSAPEMYLIPGLGQSNLGTGGSPPTDMPSSVVPSLFTKNRGFSYGKDGLYCLARDGPAFSTKCPIDNDHNVNYVGFIQGPGAVGPMSFMLDELLKSPKLNGMNAGVVPCARGGTLSLDWLPLVSPPPTISGSLYQGALRRVTMAMLRPNTTYGCLLWWLGESQTLTGIDQENVVSNAKWVKVAVTATSNQALSPIGSNDAQRITETAANSAHSFTHAFDLTSIDSAPVVPLVGTTVTYAMRFKTGTLATPRNWVYVEGNGGTSRCWFNLNTGAVGTQTGCTGTIENLGNGWYKCNMAFVYASDGVTFGLATGDGVTSYAGSATADVLAWDATTNILAQRYQTDVLSTFAAWRIALGIPGSLIVMVQLAPSAPNPALGAFYENWDYFVNTVQPATAAADANCILVQAMDGPWIEAPVNPGLHIAAGTDPTNGQWGTGIAIGQAIEATLP